MGAISNRQACAGDGECSRADLSRVRFMRSLPTSAANQTQSWLVSTLEYTVDF